MTIGWETGKVNTSDFSTPQGRRVLMQRAAFLEREGRYDAAAVYWLESGLLSTQTSERDWCEARALLCQKRQRMQEDSSFEGVKRDERK
ncbi:ANR family transcriptional regulator [Serratia marcescens]|uniref:ANR family transcriptional regulator n=1 Tax=Serratia marcescens TaxID=615 RepID=UPI0002B884C5|nr:ANR family transcriptional regulator [Serratia marcescens]EMF07326.1 hypothetical protein F518_02792 [Serratia marcescens VGH107]